MPIASTPGNHEYYLTDEAVNISAEVYNQFFNIPLIGPESTLNSSFYFTYGNALLVMLDTILPSTVNDLNDWFVDVVSNNMRCYHRWYAHWSIHWWWLLWKQWS